MLCLPSFDAFFLDSAHSVVVVMLLWVPNIVGLLTRQLMTTFSMLSLLSYDNVILRHLGTTC